jgi:transcriptional regulator with XRE-family HTH domain
MAADTKEIDISIGVNIKKHRNAASMTQTELAKSAGLTRQMIQKYEEARTRVPAANMYKLTKALDINLSALFEGVDKTAGAKAKRVVDMLDDIDKDTLKLIEAFYAIKGSVAKFN